MCGFLPTSRLARLGMALLLAMASREGIAAQGRLPRLHLNHVPAQFTEGYLTGRLSQVPKEDVGLAVYVELDNGWWNSPLFPPRLIFPDTRGRFRVDLTFPGREADARQIQLYLVDRDHVPAGAGYDAGPPRPDPAEILTEVRILREESLSLSPMLVLQPPDRRVLPGRTCRWTIRVRGTPPFFHAWFKDGQPVSQAEGGTSKLSLTRVTPAEAGEYQVLITNQAGRVWTRPFRLDVVEEVARPTLRLLSPRKSTGTNSLVTLTGTAQDNVAVARVEYRTGGSTWSAAVGTQQWIATLEVPPGDQEIQVRSVDTSGNVSRIQSVRYHRIAEAPVPPDRIRPLAGFYQGLVLDTLRVDRDRAGLIRLTLSETGKGRGVLMLNGNRYTFSGTFNAAGEMSAAIDRSLLQDPLDLLLRLPTDETDRRVTGHVMGTRWEADVNAIGTERYRDPDVSPYQGEYSLVQWGAAEGSQLPAGHGWGELKVRPDGRVLLRMTLPDGTTFSQAGLLCHDGSFPVFARLYGRRGVVLGWLHLVREQRGEFPGWFTWIRPRGVKGGLYANGFIHRSLVMGAPVWRATTNELPDQPGPWTLELTAGNLPTPLVWEAESNDAPWRWQRKPWRFKGRVRLPADGRVVAFQGVHLASRDAGYGFFQDSNQVGAVWLRPRESRVPTRPLIGLCLSPYLGDQNPGDFVVIDPEQVRERMTWVVGHTRWIRTFGATRGRERAGEMARGLGLKTALGAWMGANLLQNQLELDRVMDAVREGWVDVAVIGDNALTRGDLTLAQLLGFLRQFKSRYPEVPVTTAETDRIWLAHPELLAAVDVVYVNLFPFLDGVAIQEAIAEIERRYAGLLSRAGALPVVIAGTGWPDQGDPIRSAIPSVANAASYLEQFIQWAEGRGVGYFYFSAFDEPWREASEGTHGAHWGLWDQFGRLKPGMPRTFRR